MKCSVVFAALLAVAATRVADVPIASWLGAINPALTKYAESFDEYGYSGQSILLAAAAEDLHEAFSELKIKKPHRRLILKAFEAGLTVELSPPEQRKAHNVQRKAELEHEIGKIDADSAEKLDEEMGGPPRQEPSKRKQLNKRDPPTLEGGKCAGKAELCEDMEGSIDFEARFSNTAVVDAQQWFDKFSNKAVDDFVTEAANGREFKKLLAMCQRGEIADDAQVYDTVPLLNWLGQYFGQEGSDTGSLDELLKCLIESGVASDSQLPLSKDVLLPRIILAYRSYPLLLQAVETIQYPTITALLRQGADLAACYRLPDGRSTNMTALHSSQRLSDPVSALQAPSVCSNRG
jgi:hypothetical protein